ncbi:MAG TPA: energy transducer TonB [Rhizomicrobium sp.]
MADGHSSGTLDLTGIDYSEWNPESAPVSIHMHLDAVDGILRDLNENIVALEVGGLLLGRVKPGTKPGDKPGVWIDRYERIPCAHKLGPRFLLDSPDQVALEQAAGDILAAGEVAVVGLYRSHLRDGFDLEGPDFELIRRYFSDSSDLVLLIKPRSPSDVSARFYVHDEGGGARPAGDPFPFRGRVLNPPESVVRERPRRLVPDFAPKIPDPPYETSTAEKPPAEKLMPPLLFMPRERDAADDTAPAFGERLKKWLPLVPALLLAGGAIWWFAQSPNHHVALTAPATAPNEMVRPLGLAVEPMGSAGQVSWNSHATALHDAHSVQLFVRAGDDQNRIDLSPHDLAAGIYKYEPPGNDVTFRLEVVESSGRISAESFRFVRAGLPHDSAASAPPALKAPQRVAPAAPARRTEPKVVHRAPPVIASGIRPRLTSPIALDVRVEIDARGRVTSAEPVVKPHKGLDTYLAGTAVKAARLWRFEPARENGKAVAGAQTLHFVFQQ